MHDHLIDRSSGRLIDHQEFAQTSNRSIRKEHDSDLTFRNALDITRDNTSHLLSLERS